MQQKHQVFIQRDALKFCIHVLQTYCAYFRTCTRMISHQKKHWIFAVFRFCYDARDDTGNW